MPLATKVTPTPEEFVDMRKSWVSTSSSLTAASFTNAVLARMVKGGTEWKTLTNTRIS